MIENQQRRVHRAPPDCPVCGAGVFVTRVGCPSCGAELAGDFAPCDFCALSSEDLEMLKVFLASRGNLREVEKHLGVSYPTARARFTALLIQLGLSGQADNDQIETLAGNDGVTQQDDKEADQAQVLAQVAQGKLSVDEAAKLLT